MSEYPVRTASRQLFPLPETFPGEAGRNWRIQEAPAGFGAVDLDSKSMFVPVGDSPHDLVVRMHEMAHAAISVGNPGETARALGISVLTMQAVEDNRVNGWLAKVCDLDLSAGSAAAAEIEATARRIVETRQPAHACLLLVASTHQGDEATVHTVVARAARKRPLLRRAVALANASTHRLWSCPRPTPEHARQVARWLDAQLHKLKPPHATASSRGVDNHNDERNDNGPPLAAPVPARLAREVRRLLQEWSPLDDLLRTLAHSLRDASRPDDLEEAPEDLSVGWAGIDRLVAHLSSAPGTEQVGPGPQWVPWGRLTIEHPPRPLVAPGFVARTWSSSVEGMGIRSPHRLLTDGRAFGRRRRRRGGAIAIDSSGSMHLTADDLKAILDAAPGAIVAAYAGNDDRGVLRVLAMQGRRVAPGRLSLADVGKMNVVDRPVLAWLATQPTRPRLWVSDMAVTGIGDQAGPENRKQVEAILAHGGIHRVASVREAIRWLQRGGR